MENYLTRSEILLGKDGIKKLKSSNVAVFGLGGVGSYAAEALARGGVGSIDLVDGDVYSVSNINRQLYATVDSLGKNKAKVAEERILQINPDCKIKAFASFFTKQTENIFDFSKYDYIVDAIDSVDDKVELIAKAKEFNVPIISSMGAGNKLDPTRFKVADIYSTSVCPLARVLRGKLKEKGITELKTVYSNEQPIKSENESVIGSVSFVPSVAGLIAAGEVIKDLIK